MSRSLNKEIISTGCIVLILLLFQAFAVSVTKASAKINTGKKIIVIDPGHGGEDAGIIVNSDLYEKTYTLDIAKLTARLLKNKYSVLLTREDDLNLSALERTSFANIKKADIFISIHAKKNEADNGSFFIFEPPTGTKLLDQESSIPWKTEQQKHIKESRAAAKKFAAGFSKKFKTDFQIIQAPAIILQGAQMPAVLIETFSMERLMGAADYNEILHKHARAIAESLEKILH